MRSYLKVIAVDTSNSDLRMMMKWRIKNQDCYIEQPKITLRSFKKWFYDYYIKKRRILFFVVNPGGKPIGHMGIAEMKGESCKLDNIIRGEEGNKGVMSKALQELLVIATRMFKNIYVKVKTDNDHAIKFYERNGFSIVGKTYHRGTLVYKMEFGLLVYKMEYEG